MSKLSIRLTREGFTAFHQQLQAVYRVSAKNILVTFSRDISGDHVRCRIEMLSFTNQYKLGPIAYHLINTKYLIDEKYSHIRPELRPFEAAPDSFFQQFISNNPKDAFFKPTGEFTFFLYNPALILAQLSTIITEVDKDQRPQYGSCTIVLAKSASSLGLVITGYQYPTEQSLSEEVLSLQQTHQVWMCGSSSLGIPDIDVSSVKECRNTVNMSNSLVTCFFDQEESKAKLLSFLRRFIEIAPQNVSTRSDEIQGDIPYISFGFLAKPHLLDMRDGGGSDGVVKKSTTIFWKMAGDLISSKANISDITLHVVRTHLAKMLKCITDVSEANNNVALKVEEEQRIVERLNTFQIPLGMSKLVCQLQRDPGKLRLAFNDEYLRGWCRNNVSDNTMLTSVICIPLTPLQD
jgi:hypothetical protein